MIKALLGSLSFGSLLCSSLALAEPPNPAPVATPSATPSSARQDPRGVKGKSPFWAALNRGDAAFLAHELEAALAAYREALGREPDNALGQYRLGEALREKGELAPAEAAFSDGLRSVGEAQPALKAKLLFALADVQERKAAWDAASARWTEYLTFSSEQRVGFSASGSERKRAVELWKQLSADSALVKARIQTGIAAADEAVRKSSK